MNASAGETVVRLLETGNQGAILRFGAEDDLIKILQHPTTSIACDCGASLPSRPSRASGRPELAERRGSHPRNQGTYPRVLGHYVREVQALTWQEAVRKMTLLPAATIGLIDRGAIAVGMAADIAVFDPASVIDRATYEQPAMASEGIRHVLVNGAVALRDGKPTGEHGGRVLRRAKYMPSRPMPEQGARRVTARGRLTRAGETDPLLVTLDIRQNRSERNASGTLRITNNRREVVLDTQELGLIQTFGAWASVTAWARIGDGAGPAIEGRDEYRAVTVVVQRSDPWLPEDRASSIALAVDGVFDAAGRGTVRIVR
jgi:hypothetical protein